jgi:hypothetical protein
MDIRKYCTVFVLIIIVIILLFGEITLAIEKLPYTVLEKEGYFELRRYDTRIVAETTVEGDFKAVGDEGFRRLFDYISGSNRTKQEIAMTSPVSQESNSDSEKIEMTAPVNQERMEGNWRITFVMPKKYTLETLPDPIDDRVKLKEVQGSLVAAVRYSGTWSQDRYEKNKGMLEDWIRRKGFVSAGEPIFARYNPPFMPWFLRRNEVWIPVEPGSITG